MKMNINNIELYYEQYGEGEPIIFSHGWLSDCSSWNSQIEFFAKKHTVILYDHRGHGKSDKPRENYSVQALCSDLYSLIQMLKLEKVTLVGFSLGGMAALMFALQYPTKVKKLVLVGATAKMAMLIYLFYIFKIILPYRTFARFVSRNQIYQPSQQAIEDNISRAMKVPKYVAYQCFVEFTRNYDIRNRVAEIKVPTLIIVGEKDIVNLKASQYLNREIEGSQLQVMSATGHSVMIEKPEEFNETVREFIDQGK